jgi:N-acetylneuraminic acid mutarotase
METTASAFLIRISPNLKNFSLEELPPMNNQRASHSTLFYDGHVYVVGGYKRENNSLLSACERFNLQSRKWEKIASMNIERSKPSVFQLKGHIYSFGGVYMNTPNADGIPK